MIPTRSSASAPVSWRRCSRRSIPCGTRPTRSSAETGAGLTLVGKALLGIPATTHSITGSIIGVGATQRLSVVRWGVARNIVIAWLTTIPASALMAALSHRLMTAVF